MKVVSFLVIAALILTSCQCDKDVGMHKLQEMFAWNYFNLSGSQNVVMSQFPSGLDIWHHKIFLGFPRRSEQHPGTLYWIDMLEAENTQSPNPLPYPNANMNRLNSSNTMTSVFRPRVDKCNRLWVVDTGVILSRGQNDQTISPSIIIFNLETDQVIRRIPLRNRRDFDYNDPSGLVSITVDVSSDNCNDAYAYIPDTGNSKLLVYSYRLNRTWRVRHNLLYFNPEEGNYNYNGLKFQWHDGVISVALSPPKPGNDFRTAYFHAISSFRERVVDTSVLRNSSLATRAYHNNDFKSIGHKGYRTQTGSHTVDPNSGVLLMAEIGRNAITCWNPLLKRMFPANIGVIAQSPSKLYYPTDVIIDGESDYWVMSNKLPQYLFSTLNPNEVNFRIYRGSLWSSIAGTVCDPSSEACQNALDIYRCTD